MKQTNNAIKFLLAQYRAIFKHAYLKGLASAVVLTAALSAGATANAKSYAYDDLSGETKLETIDGSSNTVAAEFTDSNTTWKQSLNITSGSSNTIKGTAASSKANGDATTLTISTTANSTDGLTISASGNSATFDVAIHSINITKGTLALSLEDSASLVSVSANTITVGDSDSATQDSIVDLKSGASFGNAASGTRAASTLTLNKDGVIKFSGTSVLAGMLDGRGGTLSFESGDGTIKAVSSYADGDTTITEEGTAFNLPVAAGKTATIALTPKTDAAKNTYRGVLTFGQGSNINLQQADGTSGGFMQITSGSATAGSIVEINSGAILTSTGNTGDSVGTITVKGAADTDIGKSELRIDASVLDSFLTMDTPSGASAEDLAGAIQLGANSILELTNGDEALIVELGGSGATSFDAENNLYNLVLSDGAASAAGVFVSGTSTLRVDNAKVSSAVKNALSNLTVEADTVTLGATNFTSSATGSSAANEKGLNGLTLKTQNTLNLVAGTTDSDNTYNLVSGSVILQGSYFTQDDNGYNNHSQTTSAKELISGSNLLLGKAGELKVEGGNWQTKKNITLSSGTLTVTSTSQNGNVDGGSNAADNGDYSLVTLNGNLNLTSGTLAVTGTNGSNAVLNVTNAKVAFDASKAATITLTGSPATVANSNNDVLDEQAGYGVLKVDGKEFLTKYLADSNSDGTKDNATKLTIGSGGVLYVTNPDSGVYDFSNFISGTAVSPSSGTITFTGEGYVVFDGDVKLSNTKTDADHALNLGKGTIVADTITLNNEHQTTSASGTKTNDPVTIVNDTSGGLIVHEALHSTTSTELLLGSGSSGANLTFTTDEGQSGVVGVNLTTNSTGSSAIKFDGGIWSALNIDLANGTAKDTLTIADSGADATPTTVTGGNLSASGTDEVTINSQGSATFDTAQLVSTAVINVSGNLTLSGKTNITSGDVAYGQGLAGVNLSGAAITVNNGGTLTLGDTVLAAQDSDGSGSISIETTGTGDSATTTATINSALAATFKVDYGAELVLDMSSGTSTNIFGSDGLDAKEAAELKNKLFANGGSNNGILNLGNSDLKIEWTNPEETETTWENVKEFAQITGGDVTTQQLKQALITDVAQTDKVSGQYGAMQVNDSFLTGSPLQVTNDFGLHNAYTVGDTDYYLFKDVNGKGQAISVNATNADVTLAGGGHIGGISVTDGVLSVIGGGETVFEGDVEVKGSNDNSFNVAAQTTASVSGDLTTTGLELDGDLNVVSGETTINTYGELATGSNLTTQDLTVAANGDVEVMGNVTVSNDFNMGQNTNVEIVGGSLITKNTILAQGSTLNVGYEADSTVKTDDPDTIYDDTQSYTADYQSYQLTLNSGSLIVDPDYDKRTAFAAVKYLSGTIASGEGNLNDIYAGTADGKIYVGQNSILGIGVDSLEDLKNATAGYMYGDHLSADDIGAVLYLNSQFTIGKGGSVALTSLSQEEFLKRYNSGKAQSDSILNEVTGLADTLYLGDHTALSITANVSSNSLATNDNGRAMIEFEADEGKVIADGGQINLTGNVRAATYQVFDDAKNDGVKITYLDGSDYDSTKNAIKVSTENSFLVGVVDENGQTALGVNPNARAIMTGASDPVYTSLVAYANGYNGNDATDESAELYYGYVTGTDTKNTDYNNDVLQYSISTGNGADTEHVARLGVYAGAAQAAITAGASTYEVVSGRMGVGAQTGSVTFADNGQGAGLWVTPIYKSHDSDDFEAQGLSYGADMDMYGVALGGDFTMANGLRVGAAFNVGSGDADGQGAGAGVSNDFDYYGFSVYGGYTLDKLSIVGDISYTVVDNDAEANTGIGKATASLDTTNLSVGVTGQYTFNLNAVDVTPHAGLRYTYIDMDDYTVQVDGTEQARYAADSMSIFSIPVGVTFSKDIVSGDWTIKPTFDLTLTANVGDDSMDGSVTWAGVDNLQTNLESEVIDNFTYGATLGVAAKSGNFSLGFGVNYTGASSADEYGVSANARFVF